MKVACFLLRFVFVPALVLACTPPLRADSRPFALRNFDRLDLGTAFRIEVHQGAAFRVVADGVPRDLKDLEASVVGTTLRMRLSSTAWQTNKRRVRLSITMPTLRGLRVGGAALATVEGFSNLGTVDVVVGEGTKAKLNFSAKNVNLGVAGASVVTLSGNTAHLSGVVSGASELKAYDFEITNARFELSGASNAHVLVTKALNAEAIGASHVRYRGGASVRVSTAGASSVQSE